MLGLVVTAFVAVFQVILCQGPPPPPFAANIPEQCRRPPEGISEKPHECCKIPLFFSDEDLQECGFKKLDDGSQGPPKHHGPLDCTKQVCILKKYKLMTDDVTIDYDAVKEFLQKWGDDNKDWKEIMDTAIGTCVGKPLPGPPQICEPNKMIFCVTSQLFGNCPKWEESEGCQKLKSHIDECSQYFPKP